MFPSQNLCSPLSCFSASTDSGIHPNSFPLMCASPQAWCPALEKSGGLNEGSRNYSPSWDHFGHHVCGCRLNWARGRSYLKQCGLAKRQWQLGPLPLPGLWGTSSEACKQSGPLPRDISGRCFYAYKGQRKMKTATKATWHYIKQQLNKKKNWLNSTVIMISYWMQKAALYNRRALDVA